MRRKLKVLVAMSGGVDSSVAAFMMKEKGHDVVGAFMKNWSDSKDESGQCLWQGERKMAMRIASFLKIPLLTLDFEKEYRKSVVNRMFEKYRRGVTPNPDIDCNEKVKFPMLLKAVKKLGADYLVTGHYARIKKSGNYKLLRAKDESKDQSYFLYRLKQEELARIMFPVGDYAKKEIRKTAKENGFPNHDRKSTTGICFIGKVNLKDFLKKKIKQKKGKILDPDGEEIGQHDGIYYYTTGQRLGPRYGFDLNKKQFDGRKNLKKWYVAKKNAGTNTITAAPEGHPLLYKKEVRMKNPHWISEIPENKTKVHSRIRQVGELIPSTLHNDGKRKGFSVVLNKPITGISEGQAIVLYKRKKVIGGGVIKFN